MKDNKDLRNLSIFDAHLGSDGVEVEVCLVHRLFVVLEADLEEVDLIKSIGRFLGRHSDDCGGGASVKRGELWMSC